MTRFNEAEELLAIHLCELGVVFERNYVFAPPRKWELDFYLPAYKLAIEIQGGTWANGRHSRGKGYEEDCAKARECIWQGIKLLPYTTHEVLSGMAKREIALFVVQLRDLSRVRAEAMDSSKAAKQAADRINAHMDEYVKAQNPKLEQYLNGRCVK